MILHFMEYSLAVSVLAATAGFLIERALIAGARTREGSIRRVPYIGGICAALLAPVLAVTLSEPVAEPVHTIQTQGSPQPMGDIPHALSAVAQQVQASRIAGRSIDVVAAVIWATASTAAVAFYLLGAWRLTRRARRWEELKIGLRPVLVAPDIGPAVFGWWRPRVIFPRWLMTAPEEIRQLALDHERQHLASRDPQVLAAATLLSALFPWNPALLWMLRRLRFAMEVDCDARVLRSGIDPVRYGTALLYVSERQARASGTRLVGAMALIERTSQLERRIRIMFSSRRKFYAWIGGACLALAAGCIVAAAQIDAPSRTLAATVKPPPAQGVESGGFRLGQIFELLLQQQYPDLTQEKFEGTPVVVALVNEDWTIAQSARLPSIPAGQDAEGNAEMFGAIGLTPDMVPYTGVMLMQMARGSSMNVLMVYTEKRKPGVRFVSYLYPDSRAVDRDLYRQSFAGRKISAGQSPWVLLDRAGKVLRSGIEEVQPKTWLGLFQQRYRIQTREFTVTPLTDDNGEPLHDLGGKELQLNSIWLAPGSPPPID
jgi:beta-lactamase regulating signal transducer with metallopeptidase domain